LSFIAADNLFIKIYIIYPAGPPPTINTSYSIFSLSGTYEQNNLDII